MGHDKLWGKNHYYDLNTYFRNKFGQRVHKITVDAGFTCPNRDGTLGTGGCIYCNPKGSGTALFDKGYSVQEQILRCKPRVAKRFKVKKFLIYFQSFTNTYAPFKTLKELYSAALTIEDVVGLSIGTRPDCIDQKVLDLLQSYTKKHLIWIEYGLQSIHDKTLEFIHRGHNFESFQKAVSITQNRGIKICAHVVLGLPHETRSDMLATATRIADMGLDGVKLHLLYVIKGTRLQTLYEEGEFECLEKQEYVDLVCDFLERLPKNIVIQRVTSEPHPDELVAPMWALDKRGTIELLNNTLVKRNSFQGDLYQTNGMGKSSLDGH